MVKRVSSIFIFLWILLVAPFVAFAGAKDDMQQADQYIKQAIQRAQQNDLQGAKEAYGQFKSHWLNTEDGVKKISKLAYKDIENSMGMVQFSFAQNPVQPEKVIESLQNLSQVLQKFINDGYPKEDDSSISSGAKPTLATLIDLLDTAKQKLEQQDVAGAVNAIDQIQSSWLDVEASVIAQSSKVYAAMEQDMVTSKAFLTKNPPDTAGALQVIERMKANLVPLANKSSYTFVDAAMILLREGLEAMLVVVALVTFLRRTGHGDKQRWIWGGVGVGLGLSIVLAVVVQMLFSSGTFGNDNALIAGWTALFAAIMLLYVSYWLHSNSNIAKWQSYIKEKTTQAIAKGSLVSLAFLSFLAVFREGTETVLFYIGMAPSIGLSGLLLGLGIGTASLLVIGGLMFLVGLKIPVRPFFMISSVLVFYLCFKFVGVGINQLQAGGLIPATTASYLPASDTLGIFPTWETTVPQLILVIVAIIAIIWNRVRDQRLHQNMAAKH